MITYLKLPLAWRRNPDSTSKATQGDGNYWSSSWDSNNKFKWTYIYTSMIEVGTGAYTNYWASIRPFRNAIVIPDNSWTVLYQWTWVSWIYHNTTLWLISISSDGTNWLTISDKNCWASTVWNSWDNLSDDNCGKFYQAWNNYWFPRTWTVTTSSSKVNASTYWPWNYYESSTFITGSQWSGWWDSSNNKNLRWWEDWNVPV